MGDIAKVIALNNIRASQKHQALRQQLHERFDQWLDALEHQLPEAELTLQGSVRDTCISRARHMHVSRTDPFFPLITIPKSFCCCWGCGVVGNAQRCPAPVVNP